jgi:F-type H+-transporting ATPase subunit delta
VANTLQLLIEKGRETLVGAVYEDYVKIAGEALGQANATVTSALPLTVEEATNVKAQFEQMIGKKVRIENIVDPSLLGGLQVRIGDRLYDGSLSGKLARLEKSLKQAQAL